MNADWFQVHHDRIDVIHDWLTSLGLRDPERGVRDLRDLVERGMKNKDIAVALGIRTGTVKIHLKHIFEKTGIHGRYGLALSGLKEKGLLAPVLAETM